MTQIIKIEQLPDSLRVSSPEIAIACQIDHPSVVRLISTHLARIEKHFGRVGFEIRPFQTAGGTQNQRVALLTEDQSTFLITLFRNTDPVLEFKAALVVAFRDAKQRLSLPPSPAPSPIPLPAPEQEEPPRYSIYTYTRKMSSWERAAFGRFIKSFANSVGLSVTMENNPYFGPIRSYPASLLREAMDMWHAQPRRLPKIRNR